MTPTLPPTPDPAPSPDSTPPRDHPPAGLVDWNLELSSTLDVPPADVNRILSLAGIAAHRVVRPAAPVTTFLVGYATARMVDQGVDAEEAFARATATAEDLIAAYGSRSPGAE